MNGIEILNEVTQYTGSTGNLIGGIIATLLSLLFLFIAILVITDKENKTIGGFLICIIFTIILIFPAYKGISSFINRIPYQIYKVTISDDVKFSEFTDKYEIISQEGKIYTVKLKDGD